MPPSVDSPVQTQLPLPVPDGVLGSARIGSGGICTRPVGRRRIFVQTDTGSVLGIELDRADNVQTVKKKMQNMLNVPTEQTALVFGDTILKSDLSELRNDSPLLLTRGLQRSLSTPCLSPCSDMQAQVDGSQPLEFVGGSRGCPKMKRIVDEIAKAMECGVEPVPVSGGLGGAYYFRNSRGESIAIMKPTDEEPFAPNNPKGFVGKMLGQPGLKRAVRVGETGVREVAAYLLDHGEFAKVPPTVLVKVSHHVFHVNSATSVQKGPGKACSPVAKIASCQQFVHHDFDASDHGSSRFSVAAVHRIGILDVRIFNTDRHAGNILVRKVSAFDRQGAWCRSNVHVNEALELIPIDHGLCLPEALEDPYFEWLHWPQASVPFSEEELDYIRKLDEIKDVEKLREGLPMLREACLRMLILSTTFLKKAAAAGLCLAEIGEMMTRDGMDEASELELLCLQAKLQVERQFSSANSNDDDIVSERSYGEEELLEQFDFEMDLEEERKFRVATDIDPFLSEIIDNMQCSSIGSEEMTGSSLFKMALNRTRGNGLRVPGFFGNEQSTYHSQIPPAIPKPSRCERDYWSPHYSASPKFSRLERAPCKVLCEDSSLEEEDELISTPNRYSSATINPLISGAGISRAMSFQSNSDMKSPKRVRAERSPRKIPDFSPLAEEEEVNVFKEMNSAANMAWWKIDGGSPRSMSFRSVSFSDHKLRCSNYSGRRVLAASSRILASQTEGKANLVENVNPLSLGDMSDDEWTYFMQYLQELMEEAFAARCNQNVSHRQRLGISCQF